MAKFRYEHLVQPRHIDWKQVFRDLESSNCTVSDVAVLIDRQRSSVQRWRDGVEPKHSVGVAILTLHTRYCGESLTNQRITEAG